MYRLFWIRYATTFKWIDEYRLHTFRFYKKTLTKRIFTEPEYPKFVNRMKKWFGRLWRRYVCPTEALWGTWGLYREYGKNAGGSFDRDCTLLDCWMILEPRNGGYWDERGETQNLRWHRIGCRRITVDYSGFDLSREIVRLTRDELWLKDEFGEKKHPYRRIECYRRGTPPPDPEPIYEQYLASLDEAGECPPHTAAPYVNKLLNLFKIFIKNLHN